jgi:hypothetical protein
MKLTKLSAVPEAGGSEEFLSRDELLKTARFGGKLSNFGIDCQTVTPLLESMYAEGVEIT